MKVALFCGELGTRIREYSESIPKPMIPIGHQPILRHAMALEHAIHCQRDIMCAIYE